MVLLYYEVLYINIILNIKFQWIIIYKFKNIVYISDFYIDISSLRLAVNMSFCNIVLELNLNEFMYYVVFFSKIYYYTLIN